jgi:hypothetical protein
LPKYSENIFPILLALINHNFLLKDPNTNLIKIFNIDENKSTLNFNLADNEKIAKVEEIIKNKKEELKNITNLNLKRNKESEITQIEEMLERYKKTRSFNLFEGNTIGKIYNNILFKNQTKDSNFDESSLPIAWDNYIKSGDKNNKFNIHNLVSNMDISKNTIQDISNYYDKVLVPHVRNYFESPITVSKENLELHEALDMIEIVYSTIVSNSLYQTIKKVIQKYTKEKYNQNLNLIDSSILNNKHLIDYVFVDLPKNLTRVTLKTYKDEFDILQKTESQRTIDYFKKINEYIMANNRIALNINDPLIKTLESEVYPYYDEFSKLIIPQMKSFIDNYYKMILYEGKVIKINSLLLN